VSLFGAGAALGEVHVSLFLAGAAFGGGESIFVTFEPSGDENRGIVNDNLYVVQMIMRFTFCGRCSIWSSSCVPFCVPKH